MQGNKTYTQIMFENNCPWDNQYQGNRTKLLFVCSAGLLRSPTGAAVATARGYNARSCGSDSTYALIPFNLNLLQWARYIIFVNEENYNQVKLELKDNPYATSLLESKKIVLDIPDKYPAYHHTLLQIFNDWFDEWEFLKGNDQ
jgi:predicted protein tyrosine phosphatase